MKGVMQPPLSVYLWWKSGTIGWEGISSTVFFCSVGLNSKIMVPSTWNGSLIASFRSRCVLHGRWHVVCPAFCGKGNFRRNLRGTFVSLLASRNSTAFLRHHHLSSLHMRAFERSIPARDASYSVRTWYYWHLARGIDRLTSRISIIKATLEPTFNLLEASLASFSKDTLSTGTSLGLLSVVS
jgi:hypothetical protein